MFFKNIKFTSKYYSFFTKNDHPLFKEYLMLVIAVISVLTIITTYSLLTFKKVNTNKISTLKTEARVINNTVNESLNYINQINNYMGRQIVDHGKVDLNFILKLFRDAEKIQNKNSELFSWSHFDWMNQDNYLVISSIFGIRKNPPNMSARKYSVAAHKNPWTLQTSFPALGNPSNIWIIPAGTGIADEQGNFLGTITLGISIDEFTEKLNQRLNHDTSFVVLDEDLNIVMQSRDTTLSKDSDFYRKNFKSKEALLKGKDGVLENQIKVGDINYSVFEKINNYPYLVLTGYNKNFLSRELNKIILPRIIEFTVLTLLFLIVLYFFKERIIALLETEKKLKNNLHQSGLAKSQLLKSLSGSLSHELRGPFATIRGATLLIRMNLESALKNAPDKNNIIIPLSSIEDSLEYLEICDNVIDQGNMMIALTLEKIHDKPVDKSRFSPTGILETVNQAIKQYAFIDTEEKSKIIIEIDKKSDFVYFGIKDVMIFVLFNLIKNSLYYSAGKSEFKITIFTSKKNDFNYLHFKDNGPGIEESRFAAIFNDVMINDKIGANGLGLPFCKRIMKDFGGSIECISKPGFGAEFIMKFPTNLHH